MNIVKTDKGWQLTWRDHSISISPSANITSWKTGKVERIYTSPIRIPGKRIRGGIPVCFPWFGRAPSPELPPHGLLQDCAFELVKIVEENEAFEVRFVTQLPRQLGLEANVSAELSICLSGNDQLCLALTVENTDHAPITYQAGFHPYFQLQAFEEVELTDGQRHITFGQEVVDERCRFSKMPIQLQQENRNVALLAEGLTEIGVWKVSDTLCEQIQDLPNGEQDQFLCVNPIFETVTLQPSEVASHTFTIKV